jgi:hypothetical protein
MGNDDQATLCIDIIHAVQKRWKWAGGWQIRIFLLIYDLWTALKGYNDVLPSVRWEMLLVSCWALRYRFDRMRIWLLSKDLDRWHSREENVRTLKDDSDLFDRRASLFCMSYLKWLYNSAFYTSHSGVEQNATNLVGKRVFEPSPLPFCYLKAEKSISTSCIEFKKGLVAWVARLLL